MSSATVAGFMVPNIWLRGVLLLATSLFPFADCDIDLPKFIKDPMGRVLHLRLVGGATVDYFSTEFDELCDEVGATPIDPPRGITQRFQIPQRRNDPHYQSLPDNRYLLEDQLDNPFAGQISFGNYTQAISTKEFVKDGDLMPLPHNRTQLCHYALRMSPPERSINSAAWYRFKQVIVYGFEAKFHFRIDHRKKECIAAGHDSAWCQEMGSDGFAFVIQNEDRKAVGTEVGGMGFGLRNCIAIEFDTAFNEEFGESKKNHISVQVPPSKAVPNSAKHGPYTVAYTDDIPDLQVGTHEVYVTYDVKQVAWDSMLGKTFNYDMKTARLRDDASGMNGAGRPGILTVWFDGTKVIQVPLDLVGIVNPDATSTIRADPPVAPNSSAYDEGGQGPGKAWVGFTSSTTYYSWQSVDILSWTYKEKVNCPNERRETGKAGWKLEDVDYPVDVECRLDQGILGRSPQGCNWNQSDICSLEIQNAARQPLSLASVYRYDVPFLPTTCDNGVLQWDHMHPYYLGCSRVVKYTHDMTELWLTTLDNTRTLVVDDTQPVMRHILGKNPIAFKREKMVPYCITEHPGDLTRLQIAECNCEYCVKAISQISMYYAMFYQQRCTERFGLLCPCYEVSEMGHDSSSWSQVPPMKFMRLHTCRGCAYTSQCSQMLTVAYCETAYQPYFIGNPLAPKYLNNGFQSLLRDEGRVTDGQIRGDACECEPDLKPYSGDPAGRSGVCNRLAELDRGFTPDIAGCAEMCKGTNKCEYFITWLDGECHLFSTCEWQLCKNDRCFQASVWRLQPLGDYTNTRGIPAYYSVYPKRTLQTNSEACFACLHLYEDAFCKAQCGPALNVTYLHWPHGQKCSNCIFAGNRMHEMSMRQTKAVKNCVLEAIRNGEDPWIACDETAKKEAGASALDLFNGVATHFLNECPGRVMPEGGAVCVPNIYAMPLFEWQVLSRMAAINNTVWANGMECLNAVCDLVSRQSCYIKIAVMQLNQHFDDRSGRVKGTRYNNAVISGSALQLRKQLRQYVVTEPIPYVMENTTFEVWVEVDPSELVSNVGLYSSVNASNLWKEDYLAYNGNDGEMETYWSSQLGTRGKMQHHAYWTTDLNESLYAGGIDVYWKEPAADFTIRGSHDQIEWFILADVIGNTNAYTRFNVFFQARWIQIEMTKAAETRPQGPGYLQPVYSVIEVEVLLDDNLARLKNTNISIRYSRPPDYFRDNDDLTWWAAPPYTSTAKVFLDFGEVTADISIISVRWWYRPKKFHLYRSDQPCRSTEETSLESMDFIATYTGSQVIPEEVVEDYWTGRCVAIWIEAIDEVYGVPLVGLAEIKAFTEADNLSPTSSVNQVIPSDNAVTGYGTVDGHNASFAMDGDPSTYWLLQPDDQRPTLIIDLGSQKLVVSAEVKFATVDGISYQASRFSIYAGKSPFNLQEYDTVSGYIELVRRCVIYAKVQFVRLEIQQVFGTNPLGRVAIEDVIIYEASDNIGSRTTAAASATSSWVSCETCYERYSGGTTLAISHLHAAKYAFDGDVESWYGLPYGTDKGGQGWLDVLWNEPTEMNLVVIRWRFPAEEVTCWCFETATTDKSRLVGDELRNTAYLTPVALIGTQNCQKMRVIFGVGIETFGGQGVVAVRELEVYPYKNNSALNVPVIASDGTIPSLAVDPSTATKWTSESGNPTNITIDMEKDCFSWGLRVIFPSNSIAKEFQVYVTSTGTDATSAAAAGDWRSVAGIVDNRDREVFIIKDFTARFVQLRLLQTWADQVYSFSLRAVMVLSATNLARDYINKEVFAPVGWNHSGFETVDGDDFTFWISEPLSTEAWWQVDLENLFFIAGGVDIKWMPGFEAQDFDLYFGDFLWNMTYLDGARGNNQTNMTFDKIWEGRYLEIRMWRPSPINGDGLYAMLSVDVIFEANLAIGKNAYATSTIDAEIYKESNSMDDWMPSIWQPNQGTDETNIVYDLQYDFIISGFDVHWRHPPVEYAVEGLDPVTQSWVEVTRFYPEEYAPDVGLYQRIQDGFILRKIRIVVYKTREQPAGKLLALREVLIHYPGSFNYAYGTPGELIDVSSNLIPGNPKTAAMNGDERFSYWLPGWGQRSGWLMFTLPDAADGTPYIWVGRMTVWWRFAPNTYHIKFLYESTQGWTTVYSGVDEVGTAITDFALMRRAKKVNISIDHTMTEIGIFNIGVYDYYSELPPAVELRDNPWQSSAMMTIDKFNQTYWMAPVGQDDVEVMVDLLKVYMAYDIQVWFGFQPKGMKLYISVDGIEWESRLMTSFGSEPGRKKLQFVGEQFPVQYVKVIMIKSYDDRSNDEHAYGTSIRDVAIYRFRNLARNKTSWASSVWEYPANWATDGDPDTFWHSRWKVNSAFLDIDLGSVKNIAGMQFLFGEYAPGVVHVLHAYEQHDDQLAWSEAYYNGVNEEMFLNVSDDHPHFNARWIRLFMMKPWVWIFNPDDWGNMNTLGGVLTVRELYFWEHTGGGGVAGIQSMDGHQWNTLTYGLRQPGQWILSSEQDTYTQDIQNAYSTNDDVGIKFQFVITFQTISSTATEITQEIVMYRNGMQYGDKSYRVVQENDRLSAFNNTRVVIGVRSTWWVDDHVDPHVDNSQWPPQRPADYYQDDPDRDEPWFNVKHGATHNPFFSGRVYNVTIIKNALSPEEVRGLYGSVAVEGVKELKCHCFDACPTGSTRFFPDVPVPCSGQGVCIRDSCADTASCPTQYTGYCQCVQGYSGFACEDHCSDLSMYGCCEDDDDCPESVHCILETRACSV